MPPYHIDLSYTRGGFEDPGTRTCSRGCPQMVLVEYSLLINGPSLLSLKADSKLGIVTHIIMDCKQNRGRGEGESHEWRRRMLDDICQSARYLW
jgi:hypothetical protein